MPTLVSPRFLINYFADKQFCQKARTFRVFCIYSDKSLSCKFSRQKCNFCKQILHFCKPDPEFPKTRTISSKIPRATRQKPRNNAAKTKERRGKTRVVPQLVDKHSPYDKQFIYAGGARGGKARLESDQMSRKALPCKACVERSDYFRAARRHKNNDIISGCRKSQRLFRQPAERRGKSRAVPCFLSFICFSAAPRTACHTPAP